MTPNSNVCVQFLTSMKQCSDTSWASYNLTHFWQCGLGDSIRSHRLSVQSYKTQFSSVTQLCPTFCDPMDCSTPGLPVHRQLPELTQIHGIESVMPYNHLILCCPLLFPPSIFPSIRVFSNETTLRIRWPKYWSFSFSIYPSKEYSGLISFRMDLLDLLAVQVTLKSIFQHHSSKASLFWCSTFL